MKGDCPCGTGARYAACCRRFHAGALEAPTAEALMRSRYSAFAMREARYLWETLAPDHEDRALGEGAVVAAIKRGTSRFMGLSILSASEQGDEGEVTFLARVFERGHDHSFVERSTFRRVDGRWRYVGAREGPRPPTAAERAG